MLLQADAIDQTMHWLRGYLAARNAVEVIEAVLVEPVKEPLVVSTKVAATPAEIQPGFLADVRR